MRFNSLNLLAVLLIAGFAGNAHAVSCQDLQSRWYKKYLKDFRVSLDDDTLSCGSDQSRLALALFDLDNLVVSPNSIGEQPEFYKYLQSNVKEFRYDEDCDAIAYEEGRVITLCPAYFSDTREDRASTLVHEARHADPNDAHHVACVGGKHDGQEGACDETFYDGQEKGSGFNADVRFYLWVLASKGNNELSRSVMQSYVNAFLPDRFNNVSAESIRKWRN